MTMTSPGPYAFIPAENCEHYPSNLLEHRTFIQISVITKLSCAYHVLCHVVMLWCYPTAFCCLYKKTDNNFFFPGSWSSAFSGHTTSDCFEWILIFYVAFVLEEWICACNMVVDTFSTSFNVINCVDHVTSFWSMKLYLRKILGSELI